MMFRTVTIIAGIFTGAGMLLSGCTPSSPYPAVTSPEVEEYTCVWNGSDPVVWFDSIACPEEFETLAGEPIMQTLSNERSVKVVYEIATGRTYFVSSAKYRLHFDFCRDELGYPRSHTDFNDEQYAEGDQRLYYLASVNYFGDADRFTLQFFSDDRISAVGIATLFRAVEELTYFGGELKLHVASSTMARRVGELPGIPLITNEELYGSQRFQALNTAEAYGYLRRVPVENVGTTYLGRHDIVVVNGIPVDMPVVAGIITTEFQTPLSHINVLSHNRGTPNMSLVGAWDDQRLVDHWDKLVYLRVNPDTFFVREALIDSAELFWSTREPQRGISLTANDSTPGLFSFNELDFYSAGLVGAKAANVAVLSRIPVDDTTITVPECGFAIPFYYYRWHMAASGGERMLRELLADTRFAEDASYRARKLEALRECITDAPLDLAFLYLVLDKLNNTDQFPTIRFRSSTNVEDLEGFNGAGLYESYSADMDDAERTVEQAIKKVYASLWTVRGFEEREFFRIDQTTCAMGILVHRAFPFEAANGVAITANIYEPYVPAFTINVQIKGISVVKPPPGFRSDQLLIYTIWPDWLEQPSIEYLARSNVNFGEPVLSTAEVQTLAKCLHSIKNHFFLLYSARDYLRFGMDVEFKLDGPDRKLYIKQARPYTVN